jgi:D-alanyl-D-alanine carboxypeptidase
LLRPESYRRMVTSIRLKDGSDTQYALGLRTNPIFGHTALEHKGETSGFTSENIVLPDNGVSISVLTNKDASTGAPQIGRQIVMLMLGGPVPDAADAEARSLAIFMSFQQGKIDHCLLQCVFLAGGDR